MPVHSWRGPPPAPHTSPQRAFSSPPGASYLPHEKGSRCSPLGILPSRSTAGITHQCFAPWRGMLGTHCSPHPLPQSWLQVPLMHQALAWAGAGKSLPPVTISPASSQLGRVLTLSHPQLQPRAAIKQPTLLPSCLLLLWRGQVAPSAAPAHTAGRCGWGVAPTQRASDCGGPRPSLGDVSQSWFVVCKSWKAVTFTGCGRAGGSQEGCPPALN